MVRPSIAALEQEKRAHRVYAARIADLRAQGGSLVVINKREHPQQWQAWLAYFRAKGLATLVDLMENSYERTVPTWWPHDLDLDAPPHRDRRQAND